MGLALQFLGAVAIILPFALFQLGRLSRHAYAYLRLGPLSLRAQHRPGACPRLGDRGIAYAVGLLAGQGAVGGA